MSSSILNFILNLFQTGGWGVTWVVVLLLFLACLSLPRYVNEEFIVYNLITFMVFVVIVGFFRGDKFGPYRAAFTDSANRMMLHILPLFIFHLVMKYGYFLGNKQGSMRDVSADLEDELSRRNFIVQ